MDDANCITDYLVIEEIRKMTTQELIDKIREIKGILKDVEGESPEDERNLDNAIQICDDILLEWKIENAKVMKQ